jgi:phosphate transport system permease protein
MRASSRRTQRLAFGLIWAAGAVAVMVLLFLIGYVVIKGAPAINAEFLFSPPRGGLGGEGGISSCIVATLWIVVVTMLLLVPLGLGAAVYMAEYAPENRLTGFVRYGVELLAGVPSIVFGLFGYAVFVTVLSFHFSILSGALTLVCLLLPFLTRTAEEAMRSVPRAQREAALALGATKWQVVTRVVVPAAMPGIITGIILCIGRTVSESAPLFVTMGGSSQMPDGLLSPGRTLAVHVFYLAMETNALEKALATGAVLVVLILFTNLLTNSVSKRLQARMMGAR